MIVGISQKGEIKKSKGIQRGASLFYVAATLDLQLRTTSIL